MNKNNKNKFKLNIYTALVIYVTTPLIIVTLVLGVFMIMLTGSNMKDITNKSMVSLIKEVGYSFDYFTKTGNNTVETFATAPIVKEYLLNPDDEVLAAKAQQYTLDYFGALEGWEGIYIADWNSKVLTHPAPPVIGKVMREGDRLEQLRNDMLNANGVLNYGIITSPASGQLIISMYVAVFDDACNPIGYVGAGTFVTPICDAISDVSTLGIDSAYLYYVGKDGTIVYHPNEDKIGKPVENAIVLDLLEQMNEGEYPESTNIEYEYNGVEKYAAYYVGDTGNYITVLTADASDVNSVVVKSITIIVTIATLGLLLSTAISLLTAKKIAVPLKNIAKTTIEFSNGNIVADINATSHIREIVDIIDASKILRENIYTAIHSVNECVSELDDAIVAVSSKTDDNVSSISQINASIEEVADTSQQVASSAQEMNERANNLGLSIDDISASVSKLKTMSDSINDANSDASVQMDKALQSSEKSVVAVDNIVTKLSETDKAIAQVRDCVDVITDITSQTNLLSLNASIEAARAGEFGRGFSVVAEEIRKLADASKERAEQINSIILTIIELSKDNVGLIHDVKDVIDEEVFCITDTRSKFDILSSAVETSFSEIQNINSMTDSLKIIKAKLVDSTNDLSSISEELGASAEEVSASCAVVSVSCDDAKRKTEEMLNANKKLLKSIEFFKL